MSLLGLEQEKLRCFFLKLSLKEAWAAVSWREKLRVPTNTEREFRGLVKMPFQKQLQVASEQARQVHLLYRPTVLKSQACVIWPDHSKIQLSAGTVTLVVKVTWIWIHK